MSEKLFFRLYWRPYLLLGVSFLLVFISSLAPSLLPHLWLDRHIPGYFYWMYRAEVWIVKASLIIYIISLVRAFTAGYFPRLDKVCSLQGRAEITGYKKTWSRGKQLCPILAFEAGGQQYSCALNDARGSREKDGDRIEKGFAIGLRRKIMYNGDNPLLFYVSGEQYYSRTAAVLRYVLMSALYFISLYLGFFIYLVR